jgi:hypothetical protein
MASFIAAVVSSHVWFEMRNPAGVHVTGLINALGRLARFSLDPMVNSRSSTLIAAAVVSHPATGSDRRYPPVNPGMASHTSDTTGSPHELRSARARRRFSSHRLLSMIRRYTSPFWGEHSISDAMLVVVTVVVPVVDWELVAVVDTDVVADDDTEVVAVLETELVPDELADEVALDEPVELALDDCEELAVEEALVDSVDERVDVAVDVAVVEAVLEAVDECVVTAVLEAVDEPELVTVELAVDVRVLVTVVDGEVAVQSRNEPSTKASIMSLIPRAAESQAFGGVRRKPVLVHDASRANPTLRPAWCTVSAV